jgi:amino acid permease
VKSFADLGAACFGQTGKWVVAVTIALNQVMCCIGYIMFFQEQFQQILWPANGGGVTGEIKRVVYIISLIALVPMATWFESMKQLSYLSIIALSSIISALAYILITDLTLILPPATYDLSHELFRVTGVPFFFGTALFMFEGNAIALEIYQ